MSRDFSSVGNQPPDDKPKRKTPKKNEINAGLENLDDFSSHEKKHHKKENFVKKFIVPAHIKQTMDDLEHQLEAIKDQMYAIESKRSLVGAQVEELSGLYDHHFHFSDDNASVDIYKRE